MAANELPLDESLMPLLVARSGRKLLEMMQWAMERRPVAWLTRVLEWSSMSPELARELEAEMKMYGLKRAETEEDEERGARALRLLFLLFPGARERVAAEDRAEEKAEGKAEGLREGVTDLCEVLGVSLTAEQREHVTSLDVAGLEALRAHLKAHRAWPPAK